MTRRELFALLEQRVSDPSLAAEQERAIWERCGTERALLVLDMAGFTRLTKRHGILQFLAVYARACAIARRAIEGAGGEHVKSEADNVIATFDRVMDALAAARAIHAESAALDRTLPEDDRVEACLAVGFGRFLRLADDVYGDEVNVTFKLGEDVARPREILLTEGAHARLAAEGHAVEVEERAARTSGIELRFFKVL